MTVQTVLGHKQIDTTLGYARLYDGTVAADYYRAMAEVEGRMGPQPFPLNPVPDAGRLLALVDGLWSGTLTDAQRDTARALRSAILALAEHQTG